MKLKYMFGVLAVALLFVGVLFVIPTRATANTNEPQGPIVQHPEYSLANWTLVIYAWQGEMGVAATTVQGFGTAKACREAAEFALAHRHTQDAFCVTTASR